MCEILAPSGDKNSALAAINSGANAIYLGLKQFSARASAENFGEQELKDIINLAHLFGVKVYVALNTLVKQDEVDKFCEQALKAWNMGADALILQDIFLGAALKEQFPQITLHLSTQAGVCNEYGANLAKRLGFSRVILARETRFEDIKKIAKIIETEVFVQGALCACFSGQCYLSSFVGGNSGNRGRCKQPCRKLYSVDRKGFEQSAYRLSLSDLSVGENIIKLAEAGVQSFKIEGRMRRAEYVAAAVTYYKDILGNAAQSEKSADFSALKRVYNRGNYTSGLALGQDKTFLSPSVQGHMGEFVGIVKVADKKYICDSREKCTSGDCFKIMRDGREVCGANFGGACKGGFILNSSSRLKNGDKVFITTDADLGEKLLSKKRILDIELCAYFAEGKSPEVIKNGKSFKSEQPLAVAENRPLSEEDIKNCFKKLDGLPLRLNFKEVKIEGKPYMGMAALNAFRRSVYARFIDSFTQTQNRNLLGKLNVPCISGSNNNLKAVICSNLNGVKADIGILKLSSFAADACALAKNFSGKKYLYAPPFLSGEDIALFKRAAQSFDGIYCQSSFGIELARELGKSFFAGSGMNISNTIAATKVAKEGADFYCISQELTMREAAPLAGEKAFYFDCGDIKVMDLIFCPFGKTCSTCDRRGEYTLTDADGRNFTLKRYEASGCHFELYNCAALCAQNNFAGSIFDFTLRNAAELCALSPEQLKKELGACTRGHTVSPIL